MRKGKASILTRLLQDPLADPAENWNYLLMTAVQTEKLDVINVLLEDSRVDPRAGLSSAAMKNNVDILNAIFATMDNSLGEEGRKHGPLSDKWYYVQAIANAARVPSPDVIPLLLERLSEDEILAAIQYAVSENDGLLTLTLVDGKDDRHEVASNEALRTDNKKVLPWLLRRAFTAPK